MHLELTWTGNKECMLGVPGKMPRLVAAKTKSLIRLIYLEVAQGESEFRRGSGKSPGSDLPQIKIGHDLFGTPDDSYNELQNHSVHNWHQISL